MDPVYGRGGGAATRRAGYPPRNRDTSMSSSDMMEPHMADHEAKKGSAELIILSVARLSHA